MVSNEKMPNLYTGILYTNSAALFKFTLQSRQRLWNKTQPDMQSKHESEFSTEFTDESP